MVKEITLVNGAWFALGDDNLEDLNDRHPLGLLYLYSSLREQGFVVDYRDLRKVPAGKNPIDEPDIMAALLEDSAPVIGVSCLSHHLPMVVRALERVKQAHPEKTIILGGMGAAGCPAGLLAAFPFIDILVIGEGEHTLVKVLENLDESRDSLSPVEGICYRQGEHVLCNPPAHRIEHIDSLPFPAYDQVDLSITHRTNLVTSRGCPLSCSFCSTSRFWGRVNTCRSIPNVIEEIGMLRSTLGVTRIRIDDDLFVYRRERVLQFCDALQSSELTVDWGCYGKVDTMDRELLARMAESGCREIYFGIESGSNDVLRKIRKGFTAEEAVDTVKLAREYIPGVTCFFMWGFPFETWEDFTRTLNLMVYLREKTEAKIQYRFLVPYSTTPLYEEYENSLLFSEEVIAFSDYRFFIREQYRDMIRRYPRLFSVFHYIDAPDILKKHRLLKRIFP